MKEDRNQLQISICDSSWNLPHPAGQSADATCPIRDDIEQRVRTLLAVLGVTTTQ
ncbi:hypothetical protein [Mycobacteroides chelonae]|uniref:hypothetical protein n=1 Tax=Mycobacteroides TaxID=670516 RepID=UPI0026A02B7D